MILYLGITAISVLTACLVHNRVGSGNTASLNSPFAGRPCGITRRQMCSRLALLSVFLILTGISAGRYYVGNDYGEYVEIFEKITLNRSVSSEWGFNIIVRAIQFLCGKDEFIPIFAFFSFATVFFLMKAVYDQSDWFAYGFFLMMASGYYLSSLNTVRYYFALAIALYAAKYVVRREYGKFILWILFAALFHKTVLIVIPIYLFASRKWKKREIAVILILCSTLLVFRDFYRKIIFMIYPYYENSAFDTGDVSYLNIAKGVCVVVFALLFYKETIRESRRNQFYLYLNIGAVLLYLFASFIPEVSRIAYYLNATQIFLIPNILSGIGDKRKRRFFTVVIGLAFLLYFGVFMLRAGGVELRIIPYRTWIFG